MHLTSLTSQKKKFVELFWSGILFLLHIKQTLYSKGSELMIRGMRWMRMIAAMVMVRIITSESIANETG